MSDDTFDETRSCRNDCSTVKALEAQLGLLRAKLEEYKLKILPPRQPFIPPDDVEPPEPKWQTGKPPKDGFYWIIAGREPILCEYIDDDGKMGDFIDCGTEDVYEGFMITKWSGPLEPPKE